ncbi:MAG: Rv3235 family protein [Micromonosporaceae bacterium]
MPALLAPPIRVRPAPPIDPPYDDELGPAAVDPLALAQPPLPLDWSTARRGADVPWLGAPRLRPDPRVRPADQPARPDATRSGQGTGAPSPTGSSAPGSPHASGSLHALGSPGGPARRPSPAQGATMHFLSLCLEVLNGYRPATHLRPLTAPTEFAGVAEQLVVARARAVPPVGPALSGRPAQPWRTVRPVAAQPGRAGRVPRVRLRKLRVCEPRPGVAEAAAVLGMDTRAFALALRLERRPSGWLCTLAQVV